MCVSAHCRGFAAREPTEMDRLANTTHTLDILKCLSRQNRNIAARTVSRKDYKGIRAAMTGAETIILLCDGRG